MAVYAQTQEIPLRSDADGVIRVGGTRVTLDTVVAAFSEGATPEEIVHQYPSLDLADVYTVVGYYLRERRQFEGYLQRRQRAEGVTRQEYEARTDQSGIRDRLLRRRSRSKDAADAPPGR